MIRMSNALAVAMISMLASGCSPAEPVDFEIAAVDADYYVSVKLVADPEDGDVCPKNTRPRKRSLADSKHCKGGKSKKQADLTCAAPGGTVLFTPRGKKGAVRDTPFFIEAKDGAEFPFEGECTTVRKNQVLCTLREEQASYSFNISTEKCVLDPRIIINDSYAL